MMTLGFKTSAKVNGLKLFPGDGSDKAHDRLNIAKVALTTKIKSLLLPSEL